MANPTLPPMTPVKSSNIDAIGHQGSNLFIRFKSGGLYSYPGVPAEVFQDGLKADSVGTWFREKVRGIYGPHVKHDG